MKGISLNFCKNQNCSNRTKFLIGASITNLFVMATLYITSVVLAISFKNSTSSIFSKLKILKKIDWKNLSHKNFVIKVNILASLSFILLGTFLESLIVGISCCIKGKKKKDEKVLEKKDEKKEIQNIENKDIVYKNLKLIKEKLKNPKNCKNDTEKLCTCNLYSIGDNSYAKIINAFVDGFKFSRSKRRDIFQRLIDFDVMKKEKIGSRTQYVFINSHEKRVEGLLSIFNEYSDWIETFDDIISFYDNEIDCYEENYEIDQDFMDFLSEKDKQIKDHSQYECFYRMFKKEDNKILNRLHQPNIYAAILQCLRNQFNLSDEQIIEIAIREGIMELKDGKYIFIEDHKKIVGKLNQIAIENILKMQENWLNEAKTTEEFFNFLKITKEQIKKDLFIILDNEIFIKIFRKMKNLIFTDLKDEKLFADFLEAYDFYTPIKRESLSSENIIKIADPNMDYYIKIFTSWAHMEVREGKIVKLEEINFNKEDVYNLMLKSFKEEVEV